MAAVWERLHSTPTLSSTAHTYTHRKYTPVDSLEWTLESDYDHEKDLFMDKPAVMCRRGVDGRSCQEEQARRGAQEEGQWRTERPTLDAKHSPISQRCAAVEQAGLAGSRTPPAGRRQEAGGVLGPRLWRIRTEDSLTHYLQYSPRATHTLTVPKAAQGYARNPIGAFFTS
ncbi:uncharacterized protein LOC123498612 [Portunus trituberculatus]|uniref:uncharacterized protein LOC123498612 n=1 Tax=Portunus trituberculatus TaxID=210409 RepID=UPI001E1D206F|nr:uncharacterized protein LOC123498612 [Portunus trituberculatus]XP_045101818.1 uncharacterized protein LOC123498612 [Portunus trituberculatus]